MSDEDGSRASVDDDLEATEQRRIVRERYASVATDSSVDGGDSATSCCSGTDTGASAGDTDTVPSAGGTDTEPSAGDTGTGGSDSDSCCSGADGSANAFDATAQKMGYSEAALEAVEPGANLGLGCGNPTAIASLESGETVLDLGSGAGFDCFLAAREVGDEGRVIGVDMTPAMVEKARENAVKNEAENTSFRLGEIEHLPVADGTVDVIISNCVVNLSPDKSQVFREAFRVLRPGGRLAISDVVRTAEFPESVRLDSAAIAACIAGAERIATLESMLDVAGFEAISIEPKAESESFIREWDDDRDISEYIVSAQIEARKPDEE
ncbi:arsenite methyltransferase [Halobacteria archaeon AArc-curdl1]|uniref:Arsenite methyltransferase n=1 Tax=Natronosalvus hydrolyticus TaxID=2979988 RepID=A0AAP3E5B0_9EURY|nr:arsenite methyltransferase [Halobacteria archaeon AArc-curdl1]